MQFANSSTLTYNLQVNKDKKYFLYENSVQNPEGDIEFINEKFSTVRGKYPISLREDFGGTGLLCCQWVQQGPKHSATVIDLDCEPMTYGKKHHLAKLPKDAKEQVAYRQMNVLDASHIQTDVIVAFNFSYFIFKQHQELLAYFTRVKESLGPDGIFFLDCFGGSECYAPLEEKTAHNGFKYYWDLESYNPINNYVTYHIHFKEKGKSKQKNIFSYHWRMWSLSEIRDILHQAGFKKTIIYWEGDSEDGEGGNGEFKPCEEVEQCDSWVVYIAAY